MSFRCSRLMMVAPLVAALLGGPAWAQTNEGQISGVVLDALGATVAGVTVTATNEATGATQSVVSSGDGSYSISLAPGAYSVTASLVDDHSSFGMSHTFGDFDTDGRLDLYVTGMGSTTARRLQSMGLGRDDLPEFDAMRTRIGYGNRMYLGGDDGGFRQPPFKDDVARSGWAWGWATLLAGMR